MPSKSTHDFTGNDVSSRQSVHVFNPAGYTTPQDYPETQSQTSSTVAFEALNTPPKRSNSKRRGLLKKLARPFHKKHDDTGPTMSEGEARALVSDTGALSRYPDVGSAPGHTGVVLPVESMQKDEVRRQRRRSPLAYDCLHWCVGNQSNWGIPWPMEPEDLTIHNTTRSGGQAGTSKSTTSVRLCVSASSDLRGGPFSEVPPLPASRMTKLHHQVGQVHEEHRANSRSGTLAYDWVSEPSMFVQTSHSTASALTAMVEVARPYPRRGLRGLNSGMHELLNVNAAVKLPALASRVEN
ncbi:hypothetical protein NMY22_g3326 [Coprinellus aureogranulatus]|nr:hypothetical protein NMY22_g3326 [Coprinellus aureogranulatus]